MKKLLLLLVICVFSFLLLTYKNTSVPPGVNGDESGIAYNSVLISKNLVDENNNFLPLFIFAKTSDWKQPITIYSTALIFRLFGPSLSALRAVSALFVIVSIIIFYFLAKEISDFKFFVVGLAVLITTPIIMIQSHLALENIAVLPFIFFWLLMLTKNKKTNSPIYLFFAGVSLGVGIYSYLGMRVVALVLSVLTMLYLRKTVKQSIYFLFGVIPFFILLYIANSYYPGAVFGHYSAPMPSVNEFLLRYLSAFDLSFLFMRGDISPIHSTGKAGMFLVSTLPIFLIGIWTIIKGKKPFEILILSSFFLVPIMFGFVPDVYRASRLLVLIPFYVIISTVGFMSIPRRLGLAILVLMLANYIYFVQDYWYEYPKRVDQSFPIGINYYNNDFTKK